MADQGREMGLQHREDNGESCKEGDEDEKQMEEMFQQIQGTIIDAGLRKLDKQTRKNQVQEYIAPKKKVTAEAIQAASTPMVALLEGPSFQTYKPDVLEHKILNSLRKRLDSGAGVVLNGRTAEHFRISYDPSPTDITSFRQHLHKTLSVSDGFKTLEALLLPVVKANDTLFPELKKVTKKSCRRLDERSYRSFWLHHQKTYNTIHPISWDKREEEIATIVQVLRTHCDRVEPKSLLLRDPDTLVEHTYEDGVHALTVKCPHEWSLYATERGLGNKLRACFAESERSTEDYENLVERELYRFKQFNQSAVYGPQGEEGAAKASVGVRRRK